MEKLNRNDKIYLDPQQTKESCINKYLEARDGIVEVCEYRDCSGYGSKTRIFICQDTKHEMTSIVRQTWNSITKVWIEEEMPFDSDSFMFLAALIKGEQAKLGDDYTLVRDY